MVQDTVMGDTVMGDTVMEDTVMEEGKLLINVRDCINKGINNRISVFPFSSYDHHHHAGHAGYGLYRPGFGGGYGPYGGGYG